MANHLLVQVSNLEIMLGPPPPPNNPQDLPEFFLTSSPFHALHPGPQPCSPPATFHLKHGGPDAPDLCIPFVCVAAELFSRCITLLL